MRAAVWSEMEVDLPAAEMWAVYSSPDLPRLLVQLLPALFKSIVVAEGDGHQGTVIDITLQPSTRGPQKLSQKYVIIDDATMTKVDRLVKGGVLDFGFTFYQNIFQITPRGANACTVRATGSYDLREDSQANVTLVNPSWSLIIAIRDYIKAQKAAAASA